MEEKAPLTPTAAGVNGNNANNADKAAVAQNDQQCRSSSRCIMCQAHVSCWIQLLYCAVVAMVIFTGFATLLIRNSLHSIASMSHKDDVRTVTALTVACLCLEVLAIVLSVFASPCRVIGIATEVTAAPPLPTWRTDNLFVLFIALLVITAVHLGFSNDNNTNLITIVGCGIAEMVGGVLVILLLAANIYRCGITTPLETDEQDQTVSTDHTPSQRTVDEEQQQLPIIKVEASIASMAKAPSSVILTTVHTQGPNVQIIYDNDCCRLNEDWRCDACKAAGVCKQLCVDCMKEHQRLSREY